MRICPIASERKNRHDRVCRMRCGTLILGIALPLALAAQVRVDLNQGWSLQSSAKVPEKGEEISADGDRAHDWYRTSVPSTVIAALVKNNVYPDPYFGMNLRAIPGTQYGIGMNFANMAMPDDSPFRVAWWYRTEFQIPAAWK